MLILPSEGGRRVAVSPADVFSAASVIISTKGRYLDDFRTGKGIERTVEKQRKYWRLRGFTPCTEPDWYGVGRMLEG